MAFRYRSNCRRPIILALLALSALHCDETLPPRSDPEILKVNSFAVPPERVVIRDGQSAGTPGALRVDLVNIYDDVLHDTEAVHMEIELWMEDNPSYHTTIQADKEDLFYASRFLQGGYITLLPHDTATVIKRWSHRTSEGIPYWTLAGDGMLGATPGGELYIDYPPVKFVARPSVQLFRKWPVWKGPLFECTFQYRLFSPLPEELPPPGPTSVGSR